MKHTAAILLAVTCVASAWGHDFWLQASSFRPASDAPVRLQLVVGERMAGKPVAFDPERIERFVLVDPRGTSQPVHRPSGVRSGFLIRPAGPGGHLVGFEGRPGFVELPGPKFEAYLREEGLEGISRARARANETDRPAREHYARCAKALLAVDGATSGFDQQLGLTLELTPLADPTVKTSQPVPFSLTFRGRPCGDALVVAQNASGEVRKERTATDGRCALKLDASGPWMVKAVHMVPSEADGVDWHSYWASLAFE